MVALKRKMYQTLQEWKNNGCKKAFLLVGARQTGKTYIVREFGAQEFESVIEINLLLDRNAARLLQETTNTEDFLSRVSLISGAQPIPGKTLLFLDEVQEAPDLVTMVKFLVEDGRFAIALSGSMLGTELKGYRSFPVGYVQIERMFPLDFEEFCWSQDVPQRIIDDIRQAYLEKRPLDDAMHQRLISLFRYFIVVGGMPEVVRSYIEAAYDMGEVRAITQQIVEQYRFDIAKYAEKRAPRIRSVYDAVPRQLDKANKRFRMDALKKDATFDRYSYDFAWLIDAGVVLPAYSVAEPKRPLGRTAQQNKFKLYDSDTGLLVSKYSPQTALDVIGHAPSVNFGAVYENAVAQALSCCNPAMYYYFNSRKGEVDFLIEAEGGEVIPVEVKSGKDYKLHTALNNLLGTDEYAIGQAYVLSEANLEKGTRKGKALWYLPLYMAFCIAEQTSGNLRGIKLAPPTFV